MAWINLAVCEEGTCKAKPGRKGWDYHDTTYELAGTRRKRRKR